MLYTTDYFVATYSRKKKPLVVKICECGNETYQDNGMCAICSSGIKKLITELRRAKNV